ncbi:BrnT family toxin [Bosea caraganae]|uniref:BrnT family toxin n=1 Tax=Bosea caraganae TaxID=2763117 RepID=UPI001AEC9C8A|nr:BrnT family toxin [Bosea caraganae]
MTTFDPAKNRSNLAKHGISFATVEEFDWDTALIEEDRSEVYGEQRERAISFIGDRLYVYIYTLRDGHDHAISLRLATKQEARFYAQNR